MAEADLPDTLFEDESPDEEGVTAAKVVDAIRRRHGRDKGWAVFTEVTTPKTTRRADALAVNLWTNSRGYVLHGFEVKVSRGDWLQELREPDKSAYFRDRCNHWWIAAAPGVVKPEELPKGWGLLVYQEKQANLRMVVNAHDTHGTGVDEALMTVLLRHAFDHAPSRAALREARNTGAREARKRAEEETKWKKESAQRQLESEFRDYKEAVANLQKHAGVRPWELRCDAFGDTIRVLLPVKKKQDLVLGELNRLKGQLESALGEIRKVENKVGWLKDADNEGGEPE